MTAEARPAFYALRSGGWRDYVTLLHPPYTLWHLSYVAIGAAIAPRFDWTKLGLLLGAFFLGVGIGAHALDELMGRPLQTRIPRGTLIALSALSIAGAVGIGILGAIRYDLWLLAFVAFGAFIVAAYNLELGGGLFHDTVWFSLAWGAFPALTAYFTEAGRAARGGVPRRGLRLPAQLRAAAALDGRAHRPPEDAVGDGSGRIRRRNGASRSTPRRLIRAPESALQLLAGATAALALALLLVHV